MKTLPDHSDCSFRRSRWRGVSRRLLRQFAREFQGYIEGEYVYVASPLGGALTNLAVARGDSVKNGQLLFELERGSEAAALEQAEKNLAQAQAQLDDLTKGKRPTEIASLAAQLDQREGQFETGRRRIGAARKTRRRRRDFQRGTGSGARATRRRPGAGGPTDGGFGNGQTRRARRCHSRRAGGGRRATGRARQGAMVV